MNFTKDKVYKTLLIMVLFSSLIFFNSIDDVVIGKLSVSTAIFASLLLIRKYQNIETNE